jgi:hypothetical protein
MSVIATPPPVSPLDLTILGRFILGFAGIMVAWLSVLSHRQASSFRDHLRSPRKISDIFSGTETVFISGNVVGLEEHAAHVSGARSVQSRISFYTKSFRGRETWWTDTKYILVREQAYQIADDSGRLTPPAHLGVKNLQMVSIECRADDLSPALWADLAAAFGPGAGDDLKGKSLRLDEWFLPVGAGVHAKCEVKSDRSVTVQEVSTAELHVSDSPSPSWFVRPTVQTIILIVFSLVLVSGAIAFGQ